MLGSAGVSDDIIKFLVLPARLLEWLSAWLCSFDCCQKYVTTLPDVYVVSARQLVEYMRNPVPVSELPNHPFFKARRCKLTAPANAIHHSHIVLSKS